MKSLITTSSAQSILKNFLSSKSKKFNIVSIIILLLLFGGYFIFFNNNNVSQSISDGEIYTVSAVADGDTITVMDSSNKEYKVRYIGVDTPESVKPNTPVQCFAIEASNFNKSLVKDKKVRLVADVQDKDVYDRLLRYVYLDQNNDGKYDDMVNEILAKEGYARVLTIPPDVKFAHTFKSETDDARNQNKGLWSKCNDSSSVISTSPSVKGVSDNTSIGLTDHKDGCDIKGNISSNGDKIYHMVGQKYYNTTQVETDKGEKWFCTEQDAQDAGFRKSKI